MGRGMRLVMLGKGTAFDVLHADPAVPYKMKDGHDVEVPLVHIAAEVA